MSIKLSSLEIFVAIVDAGSISRAADNLGMPKSGVSRNLKDLEESMDTRLLQRTTRSISLTEAGEKVYRGAQGILANVEALEAEILEDDSRLTGKLSDFARRYPGLDLEFVSGAAKPDLLHDRLDLIIHPDAPEDSSFVGVTLCTGTTDYYTSPEYVKRSGGPGHPGELSDHSCIVELDHNRRGRPWLFNDGNKVAEAKIHPHLASDSIATLRSLTEQGLGVTNLPQFYGDQGVVRGRLVTLFQGAHRRHLACGV
jgi:DNA-binding transcriptional LysR family regulator